MTWQQLTDPSAIAAVQTAAPGDPYTRQPQYQSRERYKGQRRDYSREYRRKKQRRERSKA